MTELPLPLNLEVNSATGRHSLFCAAGTLVLATAVRHRRFYMRNGSTVRKPRYAFIKRLRGHGPFYRSATGTFMGGTAVL